MKTVVLNDHAAALELAALEFAAERVNSATNITRCLKRPDHERYSETHNRIRRKAAARAIRTARRQLDAALAILEAGQ